MFRRRASDNQDVQESSDVATWLSDVANSVDESGEGPVERFGAEERAKALPWSQPDLV